MEFKTKTVTLAGDKIVIKFMDNVTTGDDNHWAFGTAEGKGDHVEIYISTLNSDGSPLSEAQIELTIRHELFHVIFDRLYMYEQSENETLIEWLAIATRELHKQGLTI